MSQAMEVDDFLEHHGVKGMKWGKHTNTDIRDARARTASRIHQMNNQTAKANLAPSGSKTQTKEITKLHKMHVDFLKNPDRATALRMTTGEKTVAALLAVGLPGPGTIGVAAGVGTRVAVRKSVEKSVNRANA